MLGLFLAMTQTCSPMGPRDLELFSGLF